MSQLYDKYQVTKKEGPTDPHAQYFVLRIDKDPRACLALRAYINDLLTTNDHFDNRFAEELQQWLAKVGIA
jgi:hypothetical protein